MLLDKGADVNAQGGDYGNALQAASWGRHKQVVKMLLDAGAHQPQEDHLVSRPVYSFPTISSLFQDVGGTQQAFRPEMLLESRSLRHGHFGI
jgi:hypothetical protein